MFSLVVLIYSLRHILLSILGPCFCVHIQIDDNESKHIYKHIHQILYKFINTIKQILF
jgi:hypothetical protein